MAEHPLIAELTRTQGTGLLTRFAALLVELAQTLADLTPSGTKIAPQAQTYRAAPDTCVAAVPAARGAAGAPPRRAR